MHLPAAQAIEFPDRVLIPSFAAKEMLHNVIALAPNTDKLGTELATMSLIALVIGRELARLPEMTAATIDQIADRVVPVIDCYLHD